MRTTIELPDQTFRALKIMAAREGVTLKQVVVRAVESELRRAANPANSKVNEFPTVRSNKPGSMKLTNAQIDEILAGR